MAKGIRKVRPMARKRNLKLKILKNILMKTSNKILLGIISIIGLSMLSILIFAKSSLINIENNSVIGDGNVIKVNHNIAEISFFRTGGNYEIIVNKGEPKLIIETDENIHSFLNPSFNNIIYKGKDSSNPKRELRIERRSEISLQPTQGIKIFLTTPSLEKINVGGTTKFVFEDMNSSEKFEAYVKDFAEVNLKISTDNLFINTKESGKLNIQGKAGDTNIEAKDFSEISVGTIDAKKVSIDSKGNAVITALGQALDFDITTRDFSKINAEGLSAKNITINAVGTTETSVSCTDSLHVDAIDYASVSYSGNPGIVKNIVSEASLKYLEKK